MSRFTKYLPFQELRENSPDEYRLKLHFFVLLISGLIIALSLILIKEFIRQDLANPVADIATLLLFAAALSFHLRNKTGLASGMAFLVPLVAYFYYLASFSNSEPPSFTIFYTLIWLIAGFSVLTIFSPSRETLIWYFVVGMVTLYYHGDKANLTSAWVAKDQIFSRNPLIIFMLTSGVMFYLRYSSEKKWSAIVEKKEATERQLRDLFFMFKQPMAHIKAFRDHGGNITRLEIEKINHAFESAFRISFQEAKGQEVNYLFKLVFRNDTNWNDWLIIHPRQQADFFSPLHEKWFNLHFMWLRSDTCVCLFYDVSTDKKLIAGLESMKARYLALLEAIPDIFFVIDRDGTYQDVVFKGQENFYLETAEVIGNTIFNVGFSEWMAERIFQCIQKAIDNDTIETIEYSLDTKTASLLFEMRLAKLNDNSVVSIARDITRRKKAEFELEIAKSKAEEADALKSRFLANLSHDIRTPMNIIMGLTKMLAEPSFSDFEREECILDVQQQGNLLLNMIDNTIHLSKIETNTLEVNLSYANIHWLLRELYNHFYPLIPDNRDIQLKIVREIQLEEVGFETDPLLLKEALFRLIDNAIRFTQQGSIRFGYLGRGNSVEFFVEDTGQGIPEEELENIFLRFYVIEADRQAQKSGPGLGLSIAQHFVALLDGELHVESLPGKGSRFWFLLPLKNPRGFMRAVQ